MKHLMAGPDQSEIRETAEGRSTSPVTELSDADLDRVAGAGCWYEGVSASGGSGMYYHDGYPQAA